VLVLEDLHWSDGATLDLVGALARRRTPARLLILGTYRPVDVIVRGHPLHALKLNLTLHRQCQELPVQLFTAGQAAAEVEAAYTRAQELCAQVGEMPQHLDVLRGLSRHYLMRAAYRKVQTLGAQRLNWPSVSMTLCSWRRPMPLWGSPRSTWAN
jgi:hypothetical protein